MSPFGWMIVAFFGLWVTGAGVALGLLVPIPARPRAPIQPVAPSARAGPALTDDELVLGALVALAVLAVLCSDRRKG